MGMEAMAKHSVPLTLYSDTEPGQTNHLLAGLTWPVICEDHCSFMEEISLDPLSQLLILSGGKQGTNGM